MLIKKKIGKLQDFDPSGKIIENISLQWYECNKRILHKKTNLGRDITMKFLGEAQQLTQDDVVFKDEGTLIMIDIMPCDAMVFKPASLYDAAVIAYEIGNKHLPLFFSQGELLIPYDAPAFRLLKMSGFNVEIEKRKLLHPLRTTVAPHGQDSGSSSLFSKILQFTQPGNDG